MSDAPRNNDVPVIKIQARCVLLDIEGTVSDVRFVYDVMFPYARRELPPFLKHHWHRPDVQSAIETVASDAGHATPVEWLGPNWRSFDNDAIQKVGKHLEDLMDRDSKSTGLKALQGLVWKTGFEQGAIRAELFDDVLPALRRWRGQGLDLRIYSSGSVLAQRLFFQHTMFGDISELFSAHYDTNVGTKKEPASYTRIANESHFDPSHIVFVTDVYAEIVAACQAGMQTIASIRKNNAPLPTDFTGLAITDFSQLDIERI